MVANALAIARITSLFSAVMLFGSFSLLSAAVFVILDAVDVALTEAAVGAGISTILMLATLARTKSFSRWRSIAPRPLALVLAAGVGLLMAYTAQDYPRFASAQAPAHRHVVPHYLEEGPKETGLPNVVTSILASYRGYDTLGEVVVIFTAGIGVVALLGLSRSPDRPPPPPTGAGAEADPRRRAKNSSDNPGRDTRTSR